MGLSDKISKLIYKDSDSEGESESKKKRFSDLFYKDVPEEGSEEKKKRRFSDLFYKDVPADEEEILQLNSIWAQIERKESEFMNLAEFFKAVNPTDYPDSGPEYEAYLSLVDELKEIKKLSYSIKDSTIAPMESYQLESRFREFELNYKSHINSIKSLCYLSEIAALNIEMKKIFSSKFTRKTETKIARAEEYISLISQESDAFDKKYSARIYKALIEAEYILTVLKLMNDIRNGEAPRKNPFASFPHQKKAIFETYISKDIRDTSAIYNRVADNRKKYTRYNLVKRELFDKLDSAAEKISERINRYTVDDFLLNELFDNGDGFETLKKFLEFKLDLNFIDSKTEEAEVRFLDDNYKKATSRHSANSEERNPTFTEYSYEDDEEFPNDDYEL